MSFAATIMSHRPSGMRAFSVIWAGQFVSLLGTGMTRFAITLWAWQLTGQATALAMAAFFSFAPGILMSPVAGALVDRWNRKLVMILSDLAAGMSTVALLLLSWQGSLELWHIYAAGAFASAFESFQFPAYSAAITTMVDRKHYSRTSAMLGLADSASGIIAPIAAASLYATIGLRGVLAVDIITFTFAVMTVLLVIIPAPARSEEGAESQGSLLKESLYGFRYIVRRRSLFGLQLIFTAGNLLWGLAMVLLSPMVLARTGDNEIILASVTATFGVGGLVGGLIISAWGGPARRIHGVLMGWILSSMFGMLVLGLGQSMIVWAVGGFTVMFFMPLINASNQAIWQSKVAPDLQGRVFAVRRLIAQISSPIALLLAGPLADFVFEPSMQTGGFLAGTLGGLVGTGSGAGMALIFVFVGLAGSLLGLVGYMVPAIRDVETIIPDHQDMRTVPVPPTVEPALPNN